MPAAKFLSKEDIIRAQSNTLSNRAAARFLGCSYLHYRNFAKLYKDEYGKTLFEKHLNRSGKGIPKFATRKKNGKKSFEIVANLMNNGSMIDHMSPKDIKNALIKEGYLINECYHCKFKEERVTDRKIPLLLNFKNKNKRDYKLENLELLCYNCYFLFIGDVYNTKQIGNIEDYFHSHSKEAQVDFELNEEYIKLLQTPTTPNWRDTDDGSDLISRI
jgi:hypothetical protein